MFTLRRSIMIQKATVPSSTSKDKKVDDSKKTDVKKPSSSSTSKDKVDEKKPSSTTKEVSSY